MMSLSRDTAEHLAAVIASVRSDWDLAGIIAALGRVRTRPVADVAVAAVLAATKSANRTPAVIAMAGEHWQLIRQVTSSEAERHPSTAGSNALCWHCCRPRGLCQSATAQALDPHEFLSRSVPAVASDRWREQIQDQLTRTAECGERSDEEGA